MWERVGLWLAFLGFLVVGATTMTAYVAVPAGTTHYVAYTLAQDAGIAQGIGWILVGAGLLMRLYPRESA